MNNDDIIEGGQADFDFSQMTDREIEEACKALKSKGKYDDAIIGYRKLWSLRKNKWDAYYIIYCYRKSGEYEKAMEAQEYFEKKFSDFDRIKSEKKWIAYYELVENNELDSEITVSNFITTLNSNNKEDIKIKFKAVNYIVRHLIKIKDFKGAYKWLLNVNPLLLDNEPYQIGEKKINSDYDKFVGLTNTFISNYGTIEFINKYFQALNFKEDVKKYLWPSMNTNDENAFGRKILLEMILRNERFQKINHNVPLDITVSDLSHYTFCPVSFAIAKCNYGIIGKNLNVRTNTIDHRQNFLKKHSKYRNIEIDDRYKDISFLLTSQILVNNVTNPTPTIYHTNDNRLKGAPDYVLQSPTGEKYLLNEKFSKDTNEQMSMPFESDKLRVYAFLDDMENLDVSYGYLITWFWTINYQNGVIDGNEMPSIIIETRYHLQKIERRQDQKEWVEDMVVKVQSIMSSNEFELDIERQISPSKCKSCSQFKFCNHKTGQLTKVKFPYDFNEGGNKAEVYGEML